MSFGTYRQYDSRWGKKNYNGSSTYAQAGCGATACANILHAINPSITPLTTGNFMKSHGYAIRNQGTAWNGIPACLKHFGATDVRQVDKMSDVFSLMSKGYVGVFLFRAGTRGGITWTSSGHYIAVTGYKHANGKHYIRTFDSGGRKHDGFFCYESNMKGLLPRIWLCKVPQPKPIKKPNGKYGGTIPSPTLKKGSKGDKVIQLQSFLNWYAKFGLKPDGEFGSATESAVKTFQKTEGIKPDGVYGKQSYAKACAYRPQPVKPTETKPTVTKKSYSGTFPTLPTKTAKNAVSFAYAYGTKLSVYKYHGGKPKGNYKTALNKVYPKRSSWGARSRAGASCDVFVGTVLKSSGYSKAPRGLKEQKTWIPKNLKKVSSPKNGDILLRSNHVAVFLELKGGKYVANAHHEKNNGTYGIVEKVCKYEKAYRPKGVSYFSKGDTFTQVKNLQKFLNWYGGYKLKEDSSFGTATENAVKDFQKKVGLSVTGKFGENELAKAKAVKK